MIFLPCAVDAYVHTLCCGIACCDSQLAPAFQYLSSKSPSWSNRTSQNCQLGSSVELELVQPDELRCSKVHRSGSEGHGPGHEEGFTTKDHRHQRGTPKTRKYVVIHTLRNQGGIDLTTE